MIVAKPQFFMFETHLIAWALALALLNAGKSIAARIAMMAMTTSNSMSVKALPFFCRWFSHSFHGL